MSDTTSRAVAQKKLDDLGVEERKPGPKVPEQDRYGDRGRGYSSYAAAKGRVPDEEVPAFLRKGQTPSAPATPRVNAPSSVDPTRKHTSERTAQYAPHSYTTLEEPIKVGNFDVKEQAVFSPEAIKFITNRVHEAMADALQKYGMIWTSQVSLASKGAIRGFILTGCMYAKKDEQGNSHYIGVLEWPEGDLR